MRKKRFAEIMQSQYRGRTAKFTRNGHSYYATFDYDDVKKNIYGDDQSDGTGRDAKIKTGADGDVFEIVENSEYFDYAKETGKPGKPHSGVKYWHYFLKTVQIDDIVFDVLINIRRKSKASYVYLIELYERKDIEAASPTSLPVKGASSWVPTASELKIPQLPSDVKFSVRDSSAGLTAEEAREQSKAYTRLKAENAALQRRLDYWKGQTRKTKQASIAAHHTEYWYEAACAFWLCDEDAVEEKLSAYYSYVVSK